MIYFLERKNNNQNQKLSGNVHKFNLFRRLLTLFTPILIHHVQLGWSSSSFPMLSLPLLGTDCLSFPLSGGLGPPSPPFPMLTRPHLPQTPGNSPPSHQTQVLQIVKGMVRWKLRWFMSGINRQLFLYCLGAYTFFNLKRHHPLK